MRLYGLFLPAPASAAAALAMVLAAGAPAQPMPGEQEIIDALLPGTATRSISGVRGVAVTGGDPPVPSIDLRVGFAFDSARLDNDSLLTLDALGRALSGEELRNQEIEIIGHTDAKGSMEYNDSLSWRRAAAVVAYITLNFAVDPARVSARGMGERQLLDPGNPEGAVNRRVEIRNVTPVPRPSIAEEN